MTSLTTRPILFAAALALLGSSIVSHAQTYVWTGATSTNLVTGANYVGSPSIPSDGNPSALFVFGRTNTTRSDIGMSGEFKVNRLQFESTAGRSFSLSASTYFNFVGAGDGIFQESSLSNSILSGIKVSDGPLTLGGNGTGLMVLAGTTGNDYATKTLLKTGTSDFFIAATSLTTGTVTISNGTLAIQTNGTLGGVISVSGGGVLAGSGMVAGNLFFAAGAGLRFDPLAVLQAGGTTSFGGFGVSNVLGLDQDTPEGGYTLISGSVNLANVTNVGPANAVSIGGTKTAYLEGLGLRLVVVPEPAAAVALAAGLAGLAACGLRRRRAA